MCGAAGEIRLDGRTPDVRAVTAMAEAMVPRGPDGAGVWSQGRVALGHRRLKIIDLSEAGAQPMVDSELGLAVCWNGCIYNYKELRRELSDHGYRFFSHSDSEVLIKGYHHWGDRFVDHLKGMFAFALVERDSGRVLLGRDRLGVKPLYLTEDAHRIRFASSLPALLAAEAIGIPVTGIDLLVPDVTGTEYVFIEANERPGLANHEPQPTAQAFVDFLFPQSPGLPQAWTPDQPPQK